MIYPATLNIPILQNATWRSIFRINHNLNRVTLNAVEVGGGSPVFYKKCHKLTAGTKVVFLPEVQEVANYVSAPAVAAATIPCGLELNTIYFVSSSSLTSDTFTVSSTLNGSPIQVSETSALPIYVAQPADLTGYAIDSDIFSLLEDTQVASFTASITNVLDGLVELLLPASTSLERGTYGYDSSLTSPGGDRYYWLKGTITLDRTYSRT
jgi:hypothetical protein